MRTIPPALALLLCTTLANAQETMPDLPEGGAPSHGRIAAIEVTPLGLLVGHYGGSLEIVPLAQAHHGLVLSGFYAQTRAGDPQFIQPDPHNATATPTNTFRGVGGEVGYRYYFGQLGPHGLYIGPSLLLGSYSTDLRSATFASTHMAFHDLGGAIDVGYQAILGDCILIGIGAGAQYLHVDKVIPDQGDSFANAMTQSGVRPRVALTMGYTF